MCIERLVGHGEGGLAETVLVAGVCHRARESYPDLSSSEVLATLRDLKAVGRVRHSVGRWRLVSRW